MNNVSDNIQEKVFSTFSKTEHKIVLDELNNLVEYYQQFFEGDEFLEDEEGVERIFLGILNLSDGNLREFNEAIIQAKRDWRNILYWSDEE